jgi:hypothetical protein
MADHYGSGRQGGYPYVNNQGGQGRGGGYGSHDTRGGRGHDGGRGGRGGRGGGRGRGGGGRSDPWQNRASLEQDGLMVKTNCFEIVPIDRSRQGRTIIQYVVQINPLRRVKNPTTGTIDFEVHPTQKAFFVSSDDVSQDSASRANCSTTLSRRILNACQKTIGQSFVRSKCFVDDSFMYSSISHSLSCLKFHDGTNLAWSFVPLVPTGNSSEPATKKTRMLETQKVEVAYDVSIKRDCDDDDPHAAKVRNAWFKVCFKETEQFSFDLLNSMLAAQVVNTALRNGMITSGLKAFGRSPHMFYFPKSEHHDLLPEKLQRKLEGLIIPLLGLRQSVRCTSGQSLILVADFGLGYAYNDEHSRPPRPIKLLDEDRRTLAGIPISSFHDAIPVAQRAAIEQALQKRTFHVEYKRSGMWQQKWEKNKGRAWVEQNRTFVRRNQKIWRGNGVEPSIVWNDGPPHTFVVEREGKAKEYTEEEYFLEVYGIKLKYPKMPLVQIDKISFYPVELLYQGL